jgi:CHAT domain-containing protein
LVEFWINNHKKQRAWGQVLEKCGELISFIISKLPVHTTNIILVPSGELCILPLHISYKNNDNATCFMDSHIISYTPNIFALTKNKMWLRGYDQSTPVTLLAVINPTDDLPFAYLEGAKIKEHFESDARRILFQSNATKETVLQQIEGTAYVHFACHGKHDWNEVLNTSIALAKQQNLTLIDLLAVDCSDARLVTLSACETGLSDYLQSPGEYIGLSTIFMQAGASAVISSLWSAHDLATSLLMVRFYQNHLRDNMDVANALQDAQKWLRNLSYDDLNSLADDITQYIHDADALDDFTNLLVFRDGAKPFSHPYYWAGFILVGK